MKCPLCDGKGEYMHQCGGYRPCEHCDGTGEIVQTDEQWFCSLSTEEKAKWLSNVLYACMRCGMNCHVGYCPFDKCIIDKEDALEWLKEEHDA